MHITVLIFKLKHYNCAGNVYAVSFNGSFNGDIQTILSNISALSKLCSSASASFPTSAAPTASPTSASPSTATPTSALTASPILAAPSSSAPTSAPTAAPTFAAPSSSAPTSAPTSASPSLLLRSLRHRRPLQQPPHRPRPLLRTQWVLRPC